MQPPMSPPDQEAPDAAPPGAGGGGGKGPVSQLIMGIGAALSKLGEMLPPEMHDELGAIMDAFHGLTEKLGGKPGPEAPGISPMEAGGADVQQAL